jgi:hypothetical protein
MMKLGDNLARYHIIVDDIYFANIRFTLEYEKAIEAKQVAQQQVETRDRFWPSERSRLSKRSPPPKERLNRSWLLLRGQAKANDALSRSISSILIQYKSIEKWNGILPQVSGGGIPLIDLGKMGESKK